MSGFDVQAARSQLMMLRGRAIAEENKANSYMRVDGEVGPQETLHRSMAEVFNKQADEIQQQITAYESGQEVTDKQKSEHERFLDKHPELRDEAAKPTAIPPGLPAAVVRRYREDGRLLEAAHGEEFQPMLVELVDEVTKEL